MDPLHRASELADRSLLDSLIVRGFSIDTSAEIQAYLDARSANAATFLQMDLLLRPDARKIEVLEEYLHNVRRKVSLATTRSPWQMEIHVKRFMHRHSSLLGIRESDVEWLRRWLKAANVEVD